MIGIRGLRPHAPLRRKEKAPGPAGSGDFCLRLVNRDLLPVAAQPLEADNAVGRGIQRVVTADANIHAGVNVRPTLADQNIAGQNMLSVSPLGPQTLALGVTAVLGGTNALLMGKELKTNL